MILEKSSFEIARALLLSQVAFRLIFGEVDKLILIHLSFEGWTLWSLNVL